MFEVNAKIIRESAPPSLRKITITFMHSGEWDARVAARFEALPSWAALDDSIADIRALESLTCIVDADVRSDSNDYIEWPSCYVDRVLRVRTIAADGYASVVRKMLPRMQESGKLRVLEIIE